VAVIGKNRPAIIERDSDLGRLVAGGGAEIENALAGLRVEELYG